MYKYTIFYLLFLAFFISCDEGDSPYSYLSNEKVESDVVEFDINMASTNSKFHYLFQARELYVKWGNSEKDIEYILPRNTSIDSIKPIDYTFPNAGLFHVTVKGLGLKRVDISKTTNGFASLNTQNSISTLKLKKCNDLIDLRFSNQPISVVDLTSCTTLNTLYCGFAEGRQEITGLDYLVNLKDLQIYGSLGKPELNFSDNDSLKTLLVTKADCSIVGLEYLSVIQSVEFNSLPDLSQIKILQNPQLNSIILRNNAAMDAVALDRLFTLLPIVSSANHYITLSGNKGDDLCNRTIATSKGWIFK